MPTSTTDLAAANACLSCEAAPPSSPSSAEPGDDETLRMLADTLSYNLSRITSCSRKKNLHLQAKLLNAAFTHLMMQADKTGDNPLPAYQTALQSQRVFLQLVQLLEGHDKKIRENELIRRKRRRPSSSVPSSASSSGPLSTQVSS